MSPAAVDFQSPFVSTPQMQSKPPTFTPQNPNPNPNSSNAGYGSNGGFACGLAPPSSQSAVSSRSKPRLVKRRRRLGFQRGKSSTVPAQHDSGLNSFRSVDENSSQVNNATGSITSNGKVNCEGFVFGAIANESSLISNLNPEKCSGLNSFRFVYEDSNHVKNDCSSNTSNGFRDSTGDVMDEKVNKAGFVFGANKSTSILNLNREKKQSSGTRGQTSNDGFGRFNDVGFVFGVEKSNSGSNSNSEHKESSEDMGKLGANEFGKSENVGTLFGDNKKSFILNWNLEKRQYSGSEGKSEAGELGQCDSVQLGSKPTTSTSSSNFKTREPSINVGIGCEGRTRMDEGKKAESRKLEDNGFVFGGKNGNLKPNSNFEEKESSGNVEKLAFDGRGKMNLDFGKVDDLGFVFGGNWSELRSNLNSVKTSENGGKSVPIDSQKIKSEAQEGKFDDTGFVFGACSRGSSSISDVQKRGPSQIAGNLGFEDCGKIEVEFQKEEANDVFIFGSSSKTNSCYSESTKLNVEMNKLNLENSGNYTGFANTYGDKLGSVGNSKSNFVANTTFASGTHTLSGLSYGMRKITIRNCEKMGCSNNTNDSNIDSSASSDHVFVFGSDKNSPGSHTGKLGTISRDQRKNENLQGPGNGGAVERTEGININAACLPNGNNLHARSGLGVLDKQKKLGGPSGSFGEEKQTTNVNNNRSDDCSVGISTPKPFAFREGLGKSFDRPQDQLNGDPQLNVTSNKSLFSSSGLGFEAPSISRVESKDKFCFTSTPVGVGASVMDFRTLNRDTSCSFAVNLSPRLSKKFDFSGNSRSVRDKRRKNTRGKLKQDVQVRQQSRQNHVSKEDSQQNMESSQGYSPMDFSPYQDTNCASSPSNVTSSAFLKGEDLAAGSKGANISQGDQKCRETNKEVSYNHYERVVPDSSLEKVQPESSNSRSEQISINSGCGGVAEHSVTSNTKREESDCKRQSCLSSSAEDIGLREFTFSASSTQSNFSATKCRIQKKYRMKVGHSPHSSTPSRKVAGASSSVQFPALDSSYLNSVTAQDKEVKFNSQRKGDSKAKGDENHDKQGSTAPILKTCQKWRIRGNQAYEKGSLSKAEEFYTKGINSVPHGDTSGSSIEPLVLCYSNRAAARMSLGRMREALGDCMMAAALDSTFHKVQIRAANCYLAMGEIEGALQSFSKCLESGGDVCLDRRNIIEAANGVQKAQKVAKCMNQCAELLRQRTCNAAISALEIISAVLSISLYSERLLEMKGVALLMLRRYEEVIQHCERTLVFAEKNFAMVAGDSNFVNADGHNYNNSSIRLWRWHLMSKSYFYLGRLEAALDFLEKQELMRSPEDRCGSNSQESSIPLAVTVRELLQQKIAGNEAFQSGRHTEAVEHYTAAVSSSIESHPFAAICFCNRAAAHQAMGQIADAIADCSLAMALDGSYSKAVSRRATLHEKIRDYEQAASDLQILISLLEKQSEEKVRQSGTPDGPTGSIVRELTLARRRLYSMEEKGKKGISLDHYLILGIKQSDTASEIKKAYRKAALRHHPDKAGQFLARSESGDDGKVWEEITDKVHKDADRLFKMIGEAYAVLSDPIKRSKYDLQEELRNDQKEERNGSRCSRGSPDFYSSPSRSSANWQYRNWQYQNSSSQW